MGNDLYRKAMELPRCPGVYLMLDKAGQVIYVGKAKSLRNRVSSYFTGSHDDKTAAMVAKVKVFDVIIADSEFEALLLENSLIKRHAPKYNILLKDDKGYPFIRLDTKSRYPRFSIVGKRSEDGARYFGPYGSRAVSRQAIDTVSKALGLPTCNRRFPRDIGKERPCLNHHIGACRAYCLKDTPEGEYDKAIRQAALIFEGKSAELAAQLTEEMEAAAAHLKFELAAELRDRIRALESIARRQRVISPGLSDMDIIGYSRGAAKSCFVALHYIGGRLLDKDFKLIDTPMEDQAEAVSTLIRQYYGGRGVYPPDVYLPCELADEASIARAFTEEAGRRVTLHTPKRGEKLALVQTANVNAREEAERAAGREEKVLKTLAWLQTALGLPALPNRIEAFDISNLGDKDIVAAMTVFVKGKPLKSAYRKYKIQYPDGQSDYHSMKEALTRRFRRYLEGDERFGVLPELLLIDGGQAHAAAALQVLEALGLSVPVFGMVKDDRHRTRALITAEGAEIGMEAVPAVFALIGTIQEETHRFAITYHRSLRSKNSYGSVLDKIEGVGEARRNALLKEFKSVKNIRAATQEELSRVVPKSTAAAVYAYFLEDKA